jgi:hypothetical protein
LNGATDHAALSVTVRAFSPEGLARAQVATRVTSPPLRADGTTEVSVMLPLKPGRYALRASIELEPGGKTGSVYGDVDVPDFSKSSISLSGMAITKNDSRAVSGKSPLALLCPVVPTAQRRFETTDEVDAWIRIYQGGRTALSPVELGEILRNARDEIVSESRRIMAASRFQSSTRSVDYETALPLDKLPPGQYGFAVTATVGKISVERHVLFRVEQPHTDH